MARRVAKDDPGGSSEPRGDTNDRGREKSKKNTREIHVNGHGHRALVTNLENSAVKDNMVTIVSSNVSAINGLNKLFTNGEMLHWVVSSTDPHHARGKVSMSFPRPAAGRGSATLDGAGREAIETLVAVTGDVTDPVVMTGEEALKRGVPAGYDVPPTSIKRVRGGMTGSYGVFGTVEGVHVYVALGYPRGTTRTWCWAMAPCHGQDPPGTGEGAFIIKLDGTHVIRFPGAPGGTSWGRWIQHVTSPAPHGLGFSLAQYPRTIPGTTPRQEHMVLKMTSPRTGHVRLIVL